MATEKKELAAKYEPSSVEAAIWAMWEGEGCFTADPGGAGGAGGAYCIVIPPPNVTGALHLGHAINNTLQDILIRSHRMKGFNVLWVPGVDHAGIATQAVVEKQLKEKENKTRHDVGREGPGGLVERIWAWKNEYGDRIVSQLKRMGCSCDWSRLRFTLDEMCARAVRETFFKMFRDGKVFRGKRLVNWDTHLQTSISDDELYTEAVKTNLWSIKYPIDGTDKFMTVATTRPETMLADTAVAVHPDDPRWNWAIGKNVRLPLTNRLIPIIGDPILVDMAFGSGCVKVTPAHDPNDYAVWQRQGGVGGKIGILNLMTTDGKVNDADPSWAAYTGMRFKDARKKVVEDLAAGGFHDPEKDVKPHEANVNFSDRSKTAIEPYLSDQWFVRMAELAEPALEAVREGKVKFFPERHGQQYLAWLGEKRDWPISRQLWWGHRIPVWHKRVEPAEEERIKELLHPLQSDGDLAINVASTEDGASILTDMWFHSDGDTCDVYACTPSDDTSRTLEAAGFTQDPDVLDTWFSSGLWPHSTLGWPGETADLAKWYPGAVLLTGRDIITLWVARMVMMGLYNMGTVPFAHVAINPTILDGKGERMSKSKGNGVDPVEIIDMYGADAMRFTLATMATETQDVRLPVKKDGQGRNTSEKFDVGRNFCTKLWNASRFVMGQVGSDEPRRHGGTEGKQLGLADRWILSRLGATLKDVEMALATYRFDAYAKAVYDFFWRDFCDWYLEASKPAMKDPARAGQTGDVLLAVLDASLRLLHPVIPFITEEIWTHLNTVRADRSIGGVKLVPGARLVKAGWPVVDAGGAGFEEAAHIFPRLQEVIGAIRNIRNEYKIEPKRSVVVSLAPPGEAAVRAVLENRELIENLGNCTLNVVKEGLAAPANCAKGMANGCEVFVEGVVDPHAEANRVAKRKEELGKLIATLEGRLASPAYTDKAPAKLVEQTRQQLADAQGELSRL